MDAIVVFDPAGKFVRSFGKEYHGGGHGIDIRKENGQEFLYLCDVKNRLVAKATLTRRAALEDELSRARPASTRSSNSSTPRTWPSRPTAAFTWPTATARSYIHQYDKDAKWVRTWGGTGTEPGKMQTPHGIWLDNRPGREPSLVVADRANARLQYFTLDGKYLSIVRA